MSISGLVITFSASPALADPARAAIRAEPRLELGEPQGPRVPAVLEAEDELEGHALHDWLLALPGVEAVQVVFVAFEGSHAATPGMAPGKAGR